MKSVIAEIFSGHCANNETIDKGVDYQDIDVKIDELCERFKKGLNKEQIISFEKIRNMQYEHEAVTEEVHFKEGFKLGLKTGVETFKD